MEGPPLGPGGEDITWPDQVAPRGRKASSTRKIKPQTSNLKTLEQRSASTHIAGVRHQYNFSFRSRHAQALSVGHFVLELVKILLLFRAPAPGTALDAEVRQDGAGVGEILDVAAVEVAGSNETTYITESFRGSLVVPWHPSRVSP